MFNHTAKPNIKGLSPFFIFLIVYLASSIFLNDFYAMPLSVAFIIASCYAIAITRGISLDKRIEIFTQGASNSNILTMLWIFILAGAFTEGAKAIGAIDASVQLILNVLPSSLLLPGLFLTSCIISLSIGTSIGTIVALVPIALSFSEQVGIGSAHLCAVVAGGAFFGDNLSFISDTTIAATRTQGVSMQDKFKINFIIVLPAALVTLGIYTYQGLNLSSITPSVETNWWLILPYIIVIITALLGTNVLLVLILGIISCGILSVFQDISFWQWIENLGKGITSMGELIVITLLAGGLLELIRYNGGISYILDLLSRKVKSKKGGELSIGILVMLTNICTANNTIAILTVGDMARNISEHYGIDKSRTASILDTYSCVIQGLLPYGAQLLLAAGFASISPLSLLPMLYYPMLLGVCTTLAICLGYPYQMKTSK